MKVTNSVVVGEHYIGGRVSQSGWAWQEPTWQIYLIREASLSSDADIVWTADSRDECVTVIEAFDAFMNRPDATRTDSVADATPNKEES